MGRPLTAADRTPEVGDVLRYDPRGAWPLNDPDNVLTCTKSYQKRLRSGVASLWEHDRGRLHTNSYDRCRYISRADGGPVVVED